MPSLERYTLDKIKSILIPTLDS